LVGWNGRLLRDVALELWGTLLMVLRLESVRVSFEYGRLVVVAVAVLHGGLLLSYAVFGLPELRALLRHDIHILVVN
jgi:hypothetical protein